VGTPPEHPHLPFEGGLPEFEPPRKKRKRRQQAAPIVLPVVSRWRRFARWTRRYVGDVSYGLAVKGGIGLAVMVGGALVGDQAFDIFGRKPKPKEQAKVEVPAMKPQIPPNWSVTVEREPVR